MDRMIPADGTMKVLLLDSDTIPIVAVAYGQSQLLERGVFLVDDVTRAATSGRNRMLSMRCVAFVRPVPSSLKALNEVVKAGLYQTYTLGFSNAVATEALNALAYSDEHELVQRVEEYFADFIAINADCMILPSPTKKIPLVSAQATSDFLTRQVQGLTSACLALRRKPLLRFQSNSPLARRLSAEMVNIMRSDMELFDFKAKDTVIVIMDRADDPVTPLLTPWTYQAMLHELVGLTNNRLVLPDQKPDDGYVFCQADDAFFDANMFSNWGDLCVNVKAYVDQYRATTNFDRTNATLEELKQFMQKLPQTKQMTGAVTKHTTTVSHLSDVIRKRHLLEVSLLEQNILQDNSASEHWQRIQEFARNPAIDRKDITRLCLLFSLKYELKSTGPRKTDELLLSSPGGQVLAQQLREYFGDRNPATLFRPGGVVGSVVSMIKGFSEEQNIYTQHEPLMKRHITNIAQGKLDPEQFPYVQPPSNPMFKPKEVILCIVGGAAFEEAALVHKINSDVAVCGDIKVLLVSPTMHNSASFLEAVATVF